MYYYDPSEISGWIALLSGGPTVVINLLSIAAYVLTALGLYTIAKRRGIGKPWLAWIPVANAWILGSISDQFRYVAKGQVKSKRKVLITLSVLQEVFAVILLCSAIGLLVHILTGVGIYAADHADLISRLLSTLTLALPLVGLSIAYTVVRFMALYDVYTSCDPDNNVLFLVLSILFSVTSPFFLFFSRNKDGGMPPRRQPTADNAPPHEPWEL